MSRIWIVKDSPAALSLMKKLCDQPRPGKVIFLEADEYQVFIDECHPMPIEHFLQHIDEPRDYKRPDLLYPTHYTGVEGEDWMELRGGFAISAARLSLHKTGHDRLDYNGYLIHSLKFADGGAWDTVNGWRPETPVGAV